MGSPLDPYYVSRQPRKLQESEMLHEEYHHRRRPQARTPQYPPTQALVQQQQGNSVNHNNATGHRHDKSKSSETTDMKAPSRTARVPVNVRETTQAITSLPEVPRNHTPTSRTNTPGEMLLLERKNKARAYISWLRCRKEDLQKEVVEQEGHLQDIRERIEAQKNTRTLLNDRRRELEGAHELITTSDTCDIKYIQECLQRLNKKIGKIALLVTRTKLNISTVNDDPGTIKRVLGPEFVPLISHVATSGNGEDGMLKAIIQIFLCSRMYRVLRSWNDSKKYGEFLEGRLYRHIVHTEEPSIAGKWREITCNEFDNDDATLKEAHLISMSLIQLLSFLGQKCKYESMMKKDILDLVHFSRRIRNRMKIQVISYDINPIITTYGNVFDGLAMADRSDVFGIQTKDPSDGRKLHVLGTTGIGLKYSIRGQPGKIFIRPRIVLFPMSSATST